LLGVRWAVSVLIMPALTLTPRQVWSADPPSLEARAAAIDSASQAPDGVRVVVGHLSRKLGIPVDELRAQRAQTGLDWGELLIANELSRQTGLPIDQIVAEFRSPKGWEEIARDHRADLKKLTTEIQASQDAVEQRTEDKAPRTDTGTPASAPTGRAGGGGRGRR
jgi:hypothetical protein